MRVLRDWLVWAATWVLVVETSIWVPVAREAWQERTEPTLDAVPVPAWVPALAYVAALAVALGLVLVLVGVRAARVRAAGFVVGALGLLTAAVAFAGPPEGDTGGWYVGLTALGAGCALGAAVLVARGVEPAPPPPPMLLPGCALVAAGAFAGWTCLRGGAYWDWRGTSALTYQVGLVGSAVLVGLGATARRWAQVGSRVLRWTLVVAAVPGAFLAVAGPWNLLDGGALYRWEEIESPWDFGIPWLLLGTGTVAAAVAGWRRRGDLVGWSLASGVTTCLVSLWQQPTWGSVLR